MTITKHTQGDNEEENSFVQKRKLEVNLGRADHVKFLFYLGERGTGDAAAT